jgi:hypothetical protein
VNRAATLRALTLAAAVHGAACGSPETRPAGTSGAGGSEPYVDAFGATPCGSCVHGACATAESHCAADPACAPTLACLDACSREGEAGEERRCRAACVPAETGGLAASMATCRSDAVDGACSAPCGGAARSGVDVDGLLHQSCPISGESNTCYRCEDEHCCETAEACAANEDCQAFTSCLQTCGGSSSFFVCNEACAAEHPAGAERFYPRSACLMAYCADSDACGGATLDPCQSCIYTTGCAFANASCGADAACNLLTLCIGDCPAGDTACDRACKEKFPDGVAFYDALGACIVTECLDVCDV